MTQQNETPIHHIYRWDLDKTYLRTDFDTVRDLIRTAMQKPEEKVNVPGAVTLLKELTRPTPNGRALLTFISGSPTQMRTSLEAKFALDGIQPDIFILKPTLQNILRGRFRAVRGQVGYKMESLLTIRAQSPPAPETLFGDDAEQDAFIYALYAELVAGTVDVDTLAAVLSEAEVYPETRENILTLASQLRMDSSVGRIFIHLDRFTAPGRFWVYGPRVIPITNYFQTALVLYADNILPIDGVLRVAAGMIRHDHYGIVELANSFQDLVRRRHLDHQTVDRLNADITATDYSPFLPSEFLDRLIARIRALSPRSAANTSTAPPWTGPPDFIEILRADRRLRQAVKDNRNIPRGLFS